MYKILSKLKTFDHLIDKFAGLFVLLLIAVALRLPSFFEPYWYGDEGIYLTIGHGLNQGKILYKDIVDHKTPIIYYLARVDSQLNFRILLTAWMVGSYSCFYLLTKKLLKNSRVVWLATLFFIIATSLPTLEGLIPNGELFVMGFVLAGLLALSKTQYWFGFFGPEAKKPPASLTRSCFWLILAGGLLGLGILTKVPAIFDVAAAFLIGWWSFFDQLNLKKTNQKKIVTQGFPLLKNMTLLALAVATPILFSAIYFILKGAGKDYLDYGLLYNFHYTSTWIPEAKTWLAPIWLPLMGKMSIALGFFLGLTLLKKRVSPLFKWSAMWTMLALVASALSNRPYPHYLIQLIPPAVLLVAGLLQTYLDKKQRVASSLVFALLCLFVLMVAKLINFWGYDSAKYYANFWQYTTKKISYQDYAQNFNSLVTENSLASKSIAQSRVKEIYIWGTNPMLYALSNTTPSEKFLVLFHIQDLNLVDQAVKNVMLAKPSYIVVMKDASKPPAHFVNFINNYYVPTQEFERFTLWIMRK